MGNRSLRVGPLAAIDHTTPTVPLIDMTRHSNGIRRVQPYTYKSMVGGLYPDGRTEPSGGHLAAGVAAAALIEPLNTSGVPSPSGKIVCLGIGMSNASQAFCDADAGSRRVSGHDPLVDCVDGSWIYRWADDAGTEKTDLVCLNGAEWGKVIGDWDAEADAMYDTVFDEVLDPVGLTEAQVQVVLCKNVLGAGAAIPDGSSRAIQEVAGLKLVAAACLARYPNLRQIFFSSRSRAGSSSPTSHPSIEPYAYESGFAVKWLIEDFIEGSWTPGVFCTWGPYLWCGTGARSDGMTWALADDDVQSADNVHLTAGGQSNEGGIIHDFFMNSPLTPWYRA